MDSDIHPLTTGASNFSIVYIVFVCVSYLKYVTFVVSLHVLNDHKNAFT